MTRDAPYPIAMICGTMRLYESMMVLADELTRQGFIVLAPFTRSGGGLLHNPTPTTADELHRIHRAKIAMASIVVFVTDESRNLFPTESRALYFGESTREELHYAQSLGKSNRRRPVRASLRYWADPQLV